MPVSNQEEIQPTEHELGLLAKPPSWALYWGNTLLFVLLLGLLLAAWLIRYPDIVEAPVSLSTAQPPVRIAPLYPGSLSHILVQEGDTVSAHQALAILRNPAHFEDVIALKQWLETAEKTSEPAASYLLRAPSTWVLGELQARYATMQSHLANLQYWLSRQLKGQSQRQLALQQPELSRIKMTLENQKISFAAEAKIADSLYERTRKIFNSGAASRAELDEASTRLLQAQRQLERVESDLINNKLQQEQLLLTQLQLSENLSDQAQEAWLAFKNDLRQLSAECMQWEQRYLLSAPQAGLVSWPKALYNNQYVDAGEAVMALTPTHSSQQIIARGKLPATTMGKVVEGASARIRLDAYPYREFGVLPAQVKLIALVSTQTQTDPSYRIELQLTQHMKSTYQKPLAFRQEMSGVARIVTADRSLLERLFDRLLNARYN